MRPTELQYSHLGHTFDDASEHSSSLRFLRAGDPPSAAGMDAASDAANAGGATTPPTADMHAERGGVAEPVAGADAPPRPDDEHVHVDNAVQNDCCDDDGDIDGGVAVAGSGSSGTWRGAASHTVRSRKDDLPSEVTELGSVVN